MKPYAASCDDNKHVILSTITPYLKNCDSVLEIASGTGQHAVFFAQALSHLTWQTSDLARNLMGINEWLADSNLKNVLAAIEFDVSANWPTKQYDAVFSANSLHIMSRQQVIDMFTGLNLVLNNQAHCLFYGPFNYGGKYTSDSNKNFDVWLKNNNLDSCIKDFEWINQLAEQQGLSLVKDHAMPANNRILVFAKN